MASVTAGCASPTTSIETLPATSSAAVPTLSAVAVDEDFVRALGGEVRTIGREAVIGMGRRTCSALSEGANRQELLVVLTDKGLSQVEASRVMLAAVHSYCPDLAGKINP